MLITAHCVLEVANAISSCLQVGFGSLQDVSKQHTGASTSQQALHTQLAQQAQQASSSDDVNLEQTHPRQTEAAIRKQSYPLKPEIPVQQQSYPLQPDRAFPGSSEAGWQAFKPGMLGTDLKSAESLPILQVSPCYAETNDIDISMTDNGNVTACDNLQTVLVHCYLA